LFVTVGKLAVPKATMLMLAGNSVLFPHVLEESGRTLTAHIALVIAADFELMEFRTIFACGLVLYLPWWWFWASELWE